MSSAKIAVACESPFNESGRHRWVWRDLLQYPVPPEEGGGFVQGKWCTRCGIWYIDAIEHKPDPRPSIANFLALALPDNSATRLKGTPGDSRE